MIVSSKVTWGLAWTGLAIILAVPSADYLTGILSGGKSAAIITSTTEPVTAGPTKPSGVTTTVTKTGVVITPAGAPAPTIADPVDKYLKSNKTLPSYMTDGATTPVTAASDTTKVATIDPGVHDVAPVPFPARPVTLARSTPPKPPAQPTVIVDESTTGTMSEPAPAASVPPPQQAQTTGPVPPADIVDDSANWQSQGLGQYLERNGLLSDGSTDTTAAASDSYDPNGFFLSDGPNATSSDRRARVLRMLGDDPSAPVPPESFNLF